MKKFFLYLTFLISTFCVVHSQISKPVWVSQLRISDANNYYYGIGNSKVSFEESDAYARREFALHVEVRVKSIFQNEIHEEGKEFSEKTHLSTELISNVSLKGIAITERFSDTTSKEYLSLIQYRKTEYDSLITNEIAREIIAIKNRNALEEEKQKETLRAEIAKNKIEEDKTKESLRSKKTQLELLKEEEQRKREERQLMRIQFGEFLDTDPPEKVVSLRNGEISRNSTTAALKMGLSPFILREAFVAWKVWQIEFSGNAVFNNGTLDRQEGYVKIKILPNIGEYYKTSLSIGAVQSIATLKDSGYNFVRSKYSFFISGNVTIPELWYSYVSFYGDKRKFSVGYTVFPFFKSFRNHIGFMVEANYIPDEDFRNVFGDPFVLEAGIRLHANTNLSTTIAYEKNEKFVLTLEFQF